MAYVTEINSHSVLLPRNETMNLKTQNSYLFQFFYKEKIEFSFIFHSKNGVCGKYMENVIEGVF